MSKAKRKWIVLDWLADGCLRAQDIAYSATQSIADKLDEIVNTSLWVKDGTTVKPRTDTDDVQITKIAGRTNSVPVTDAAGAFKDTQVVISDGPAGGSVLNMDAFDSDPTADLISGDLYLVTKDADTVTLTFFDGTDKYSVELSKV